jgi:uncharacterized protein with HEPN domain
MPPIDDATRLHHILEAARKALRFTKGLSRPDLDSDEKLTLALTKLLEIVGEAASQMSAEAKDRFSSLPWKKMIGMRNILIHSYQNMNLDILWQTIQDDLPPLVTEPQRIIDEAERQQKLF